MQDLIILTAHQREPYLLSKLTQMDLKYQVIDVSPLLGERGTQEVLGPFGFLEFKTLSEEQKNWLLKNYKMYQQQQGITLWTEAGILEGQGAFTKLQYELHEEYKYFLEYFCSSVDQNVDAPPVQKKSYQNINDIFLSFYSPLEYLGESAKIKISKNDDFHISSSGVHKKIKLNESVYESHQVINFLSSAELMHLSSLGTNSILYEEALRPKQCWQNIQVDIEAPVSRDTLPQQIVFIPRFKKPWIQNGLFILIKEDNQSSYRLWFRNWFDLSKSTQVVQSIVEEIKQYLSQRDVKMNLTQLPTEVSDGMSFLPIYDVEELELQRKWIEGGVVYAGPDKWDNLSLGAQIKHQEKIFQYLDKEISHG